jgi:predicted MFS family arabinose efflux permease
VISPLLSNIYLTEVDAMLERAKAVTANGTHTYGSVLNLGAAGGASLCGILIALRGYSALAIGLPIFALAAAVLAWWPPRGDIGARSQTMT